MRRGVLGGTFNPVHNGHLLIAEDVRVGLDLAEVIFVTAALPWMKDTEELAAIEDRLEMVRLATAGNPHFSVSKVDRERPGPTYAGDTIRDLLRESVGLDEFFFIMGADSLADLPRWHEAKGFVQLCRVAAVARVDRDTAAVVGVVERELPEAKGRIDVVEAALIDVSSTEIRQRVQDGETVRYRVPTAVEDYIRLKGLYA
jgi:nicotinate-nucleotide adenylyltransferase